MMKILERTLYYLTSVFACYKLKIGIGLDARGVDRCQIAYMVVYGN